MPFRNPLRAALVRGALLAIVVGAGAVACASEIAIVTSAGASSVERLAAEDLAAVLQQLHPRDHFIPTTDAPRTGLIVRIGQAKAPDVRQLLGDAVPTQPESYVVRRIVAGARTFGVIAGADARGTAHGIYGLLTKLGCSFTVSGDVLPRPKATSFDFAEWDLADHPLTPERIVFNWHNFLSGCSTWNLRDWQQWTAQSLKMGYNAIMVHAYGNNPMAGFTFDGQPKPVGYLSTTIKGRDWSTQHVNDVRRLFGGEVFAQPVFGADAGLVADDQRVPAAQALMRTVFADAARRGMNVYFAIDVDTPSANPPELIGRLPEHARFTVGSPTRGAAAADRLWLPNPDTPEGYGYFRAQVAALRQAYPEVTHLVVWFRRGTTPWMEAKLNDLPPAWQQEFAAEVARTPAARDYWRAPGLFAVSRIVRAFQRALHEEGADHVRLAAGTWAFEFLPAADCFFPPGVPLIGLDWEVLREKPQLGDAASRAPLREVGAHRPLIPIVWAHHDDGHYVGRPYTPLPDFSAKLADAHAAGFGVIHWTTRPFDLYFTSLARQTWSRTRDQPLRETCRELAAAWFGPENREALGEYLDTWIQTAPRFGRETSDRFIDRTLTDIPAVVAGARARMAQLDAAAAARMTREQRQRLAYQRGLEEFVAAFHTAQGTYQAARDLLGRGDLEGARRALRDFNPERVVEEFARTSAIGGITRGEQGLVVSLNTRWLTHVVQLRQLLGLEPIRIAFAPTSHDLLAQSRGRFTFHFTPDHAIWECRGETETGTNVLVLPTDGAANDGTGAAGWGEIGRAGLAIAQPLVIMARPMMAPETSRAKAVPLPKGEYRLQLLWTASERTRTDDRVIEVSARAPLAKGEPAFKILEPVNVRPIGGDVSRAIESTYSVQLDASNRGEVEVRLAPARPGAVLCGLVLEPPAERR